MCGREIGLFYLRDLVRKIVAPEDQVGDVTACRLRLVELLQELGQNVTGAVERG